MIAVIEFVVIGHNLCKCINEKRKKQNVTKRKLPQQTCTSLNSEYPFSVQNIKRNKIL